MTTTKERFKEAETLRDQGKMEEAREVLESILADSPDHVLSHLTLARIFTQLGVHDKACSHAEQACQLEPNEAFNYTILSVTYQKAWAGTQENRFIQLAEDAMARSRMLGG